MGETARETVAARARGRALRLAALAAAAVMPAACAPASGPVARGAHVDGLRHGIRRIEPADGSVEEDRYAAGRLHGEWVLRDAAGPDRRPRALVRRPARGAGEGGLRLSCADRRAGARWRRRSSDREKRPAGPAGSRRLHR